MLQRIQMCLATGIGHAYCDASGAGLALATAHRAKVTVVLLPLYLQAHVAAAHICDRLAHLLVLLCDAFCLFIVNNFDGCPVEVPPEEYERFVKRNT